MACTATPAYEPFIDDLEEKSYKGKREGEKKKS